MWVSLKQSVEGLGKTILVSPEQEEIPLTIAFGCDLQLFPGSPTCWSTLQILDYQVSTST